MLWLLVNMLVYLWILLRHLTRLIILYCFLHSITVDYGVIKGYSFTMVSSYLTMRRRFTHYNSVNWFWCLVSKIWCSTTIYLRAIIISYINDICDVSNAALNYTLFADDTSVFMSHREIDILQQVTSELLKLALWFRSIKLAFFMYYQFYSFQG